MLRTGETPIRAWHHSTIEMLTVNALIPLQITRKYALTNAT